MAASRGKKLDPKDESIIRKTNLESRLLEEQLTPRYRRTEILKSIAAVSGVILAVIGLVGGILSVGRWLYELQQSRKLRTEERLDHAVQLLASSEAKERLAGLVSLRSFLFETNATQNTQVLLSLSGALRLEDSAAIRSAIAALFEDIDPQILDKASLNRGLFAAIQGSRGLVNESDLWRKRPQNLYRLEQDVEQGERLQAMAYVISTLLRKGARVNDMSGIYLGRSDLSGLDLSGISFDDAILAWSDFTNSTCFRTTFNGADLEKARFVRADLREAKLTFIPRKGESAIRWCYVDRQMDRSGHQVQVTGPDFTSADLRHADFTGHALFCMTPDAIPEVTMVSLPPQFDRANLEATDFRNIRIYGIRDPNDHSSPFFTVHGDGYIPEDEKYERFTERLMEDSSLLPEHTKYLKSLRELCFALSGSNWKPARFPKAIAEWLSKSPPPPPPIEILGEERPPPKAPW